MRDYDAHVANLSALARQEGTPGVLRISVVADMLVMRDELIRDLKRVIEADCRERLAERRALARTEGCRDTSGS